MAERTADVSVVIPHFDAPDLLARALASVAAQTLAPREVIVVDDASPPASVAAAQRVVAAHGPSARLERLATNGGPGVARNAGWGLARGTWVAFLDADDAWDPDKLEVQLEAVGRHPGTVASSHPMRAAAAPVRAEAGPPATADITYRALLWRNLVATSSVLVRRDAPDRFPSSPRYCEDYALWLDLAHRHPVLHVVEALAVRDARAGGLSAQAWNMEKGELHALRSQARTGRIPVLALAGLGPWSLAKFALRLTGRRR